MRSGSYMRSNMTISTIHVEKDKFLSVGKLTYRKINCRQGCRQHTTINITNSYISNVVTSVIYESTRTHCRTKHSNRKSYICICHILNACVLVSMPQFNVYLAKVFTHNSDNNSLFLVFINTLASYN